MMRHPVASRSTSLRMWLESRTVVPAAVVLGDALVEDLLHQRVQPRGGLVEDQQVGGRGERGDEGDLLAVALGVGTPLLRRVQLEPLEQVVATRRARVEVTHPQEQVDGLAAGQVGPRALTSPGT